ncbi:unnamed protein product [Camellia sinensis]
MIENGLEQRDRRRSDRSSPRSGLVVPSSPSLRVLLQVRFPSIFLQMEQSPQVQSLLSYRTNYFIMIVFILGLGFLRRPLTIIAAAFTALSVALLNDRCTFNEKVTRTVRKFSPHLAARMRPPLILGILVSSEASAVQSSEFGLCSGRCNEIISMVVMLSA